MKRKLLRSFAVLAMALMCGNAWADWDNTSKVYVSQLDKSYSTLQEAVKAAMDDTGSTKEYTIQIHKDVTIGSNRVELSQAKTIIIVPMADNLTITRGSIGRNTMWFLNKTDGAILTIGNSSHKLTIQGGGISGTNTQILHNVLRLESSGSINVTNVEFKDFWFNTETKGNTTTNGFLYENKDNKGIITLENVTVSNSKTEMGSFIRSISNTSDVIQLKGYLNFENCTGTCFDIKARIKLGDSQNTYSGFSATTPISVTWNGATTASNNGTIPVIVKVDSKNTNDFYLTNNNYGLVYSSPDLKLAQAHTVTTSSDAKGAATLVLPFESSIPEGVTAYTLNNVDNNVINTTKVETTLSADKPVLINTKAEGGNYKFIAKTALAGNEVTGSGTPTSGLLTGVYAETTVPSDSYILAKGGSGVGFYKSKGSSKVTANHAYLTIPSSSSSATRAFFSIRFDDNGTTAIKGIDVEENKSENGTYNLNGVRMQNTNKKGLYIKNGKVFINQ